MQPLELLADTPSSPAFSLPEPLAALYPGTIGFPDGWLYANFVESLDGVVALPGVPGGNRLISAASDADLFVMALLRACADVILIGAGTLRGSPSSWWLPESARPASGAALAELRRRLGLAPQPALAIVTSGGGAIRLPDTPGRRTIVLTTASGAARLAELQHAEVVTLPGIDAVEVGDAVSALRERGYGRILSESGPTLFGSLLAAGLVDELYLTLAPTVAGRAAAGDALGLIESHRFLPDVELEATLAGIRRSGDHLFLRYLLR